MKLNLQHNKNIFISYVGLTIGGYNLAGTKESEKIHWIIRNIQWDNDIISYFSKAKTTTCEVNPYYPRAQFLTLASLNLSRENDVFFTNFNELEKYINNMPINPIEKDKNSIQWIEQLPYYFKKLMDNEEIQTLWKFYLSEVRKNDLTIQNTLDNVIFKIINIFNIKESDLPQIVVIPNHLQAPQATDIICKDNIIYIIKAEPDEESIVHEYLHFLFDNYLNNNKELITQYLPLLKPVLEQMLKYQYAWDYGVDSWNRVFEESLMRAVSLWVCNYNDIEAATNTANVYKTHGFIYVPIILENLFNKWTTLNDFTDFLKNCLEDCKKL